jgi:hypothetical protein
MLDVFFGAVGQHGTRDSRLEADFAPSHGVFVGSIIAFAIATAITSYCDSSFALSSFRYSTLLQWHFCFILALALISITCYS